MRLCLSMLNLLSGLICFAAFCAPAEIGVTSIRQPGASLDLSLRNETAHAVSQAALWLRAQQKADGSWGVSNCVRLTSVILFALDASLQPGHSEATTRAALWLDTQATNRMATLETHAWLLLALSRVLPETPARTNLLQRISRVAQPLVPHASSEDRRFWSEVQSAAGVGTPPPLPEKTRPCLADLARTWPPKLPDTVTAWQLARLINQTGGGQLVCGNTPLDWRRDLAQRLVTTQRNVPACGGFWDAPDTDTKLAETAFGLLTLLEL
ncbi:MAG: hypothetical protein WCK89_05125 [bacterium]